MKYWIYIVCLFPNVGFGQCDIKLDFGGTLGSKSRNHIPFDPEISDTVKYCCDIHKIKTYSDVIIAKAKSFITMRASEDFYNRLKFHQLDVNYPDSVKVSYSDQSLYNLAKQNVTYWVVYQYSYGEIFYGFGLEFDKNGVMISANKFPDFSKKVNPEIFTDRCDAVSAIKQNKKYKNVEIEKLELAYLDESNSFCWLAEEKIGPVKCGKNLFSIKLFYVNANTNKPETVKTQEVVVYSDCIELTKKTRKVKSN